MLYTLHMCHATHDSDPLNPTHNPPRPAATSKPSGCAHKAALTRLRSQGCAHKGALTRQAALTRLRSQGCDHKAALTRLRSQGSAQNLQAALTRLRSQGCAHKAALKTLRSQVTRLRSQGQAALKAALTRQAALTTLRSQDCAHKTALTRLRSQDCAHKAALTRLRMIEGSGFSIVVFRTGQLLSSLPIIRFLLHCFQNALVNGKSCSLGEELAAKRQFSCHNRSAKNLSKY
jgi:hypothetical protein